MSQFSDPKEQFGVRWTDGSITKHWNGRTAKRKAEEVASNSEGTLVRRTITYGEWEKIPTEAVREAKARRAEHDELRAQADDALA